MEKKFIKLFSFLFLVILFCFLLSCQKEKAQQEKKKETIVVAKMHTPVKRLFFHGTLMPIDNIPVVSPVDGRLAEIKFVYGEEVIKGQLLARINSEQLADDYRKAVSDYLQKKDAYDTGLQSFQGSLALYKAGIISKEEFLSEQSQYENTVLSFFQSRYALEKVLVKAKVNIAEIEKLTLKDVTQVDKVLRRSFARIDVFSPGTGVALFPVDDSSSGGDGGGDGNGSGTSSGQKTGRLVIGTELKAGQLMLNIGDLRGLSARIKVSEININRIKVKMKALVTGDAFPNITLKGYVAQVSSQANPQSTGGGESNLSMFNVLVKIPHITDEQRKIIHVGMTARIEIDIKEKPRIMLPLKAVTSKNGENYVTLLENGTKKQVSVTVGDTTPDGKISILKGIKDGDKVVIIND